MAIRLQQSTQKQERASAGAFGVGSYIGDGGYGALSKGLGAVASATAQIGRSLASKDAAAQQGQAGILDSRARLDLAKDNAILDKATTDKDWAARDAQIEVMKRKATIGSINDFADIPAGDTTVRREYSERSDNALRTSYVNALRVNEGTAVAARLLHVNEEHTKRSSAPTTNAIRTDSMNSWVLSNSITAAGIHVNGAEFKELNTNAQDIMREEQTQIIATGVNALINKQERNPSATDANLELTSGAAQVRAIEWMDPKLRDIMATNLTNSVKKVESGGTSDAIFNSERSRRQKAESTGYYNAEPTQMYNEWDAAYKAAPTDTRRKKVMSQWQSGNYMLDANRPEIRKALVAGYAGDENYDWHEAFGPDGVDITQIGTEDQRELGRYMRGIATKFEVATSEGGYAAGQGVLNPIVGSAVETANNAYFNVVNSVDDFVTPEAQEALRRTVNATKAMDGYNVENATVPDVFFAKAAVDDIKKNGGANIQKVMDAFVGANGDTEVLLWAASLTDTPNEDIRLLGKMAETFIHMRKDGAEQAYSTLKDSIDFDATNEWRNTVFLQPYQDAQAMIADNPYNQGAQMAYAAADTGEHGSAVWWGSYQDAVLVNSIKMNKVDGKHDAEWHADNVNKTMRGLGQVIPLPNGSGTLIYTDSLDGQRFTEGLLSYLSAKNISREQYGQVYYDTFKESISKQFGDLSEMDFAPYAGGNIEDDDVNARLSAKYKGVMKGIFGEADMWEAVRMGVPYPDEETGRMVVPLLVPRFGSSGERLGYAVAYSGGRAITADFEPMQQRASDPESYKSEHWESIKQNFRDVNAPRGGEGWDPAVVGENVDAAREKLGMSPRKPLSERVSFPFRKKK